MEHQMQLIARLDDELEAAELELARTFALLEHLRSRRNELVIEVCMVHAKNIRK